MATKRAAARGASVEGPKGKGPEFLRFIVPIVEVLRELGSSGTPSEVTDLVIQRCKISEKEQGLTTSNGQSRVKNQVAWARFYLAKDGLLDNSRRGVWVLTEKGVSSRLATLDDARELFARVQSRFSKPAKGDSVIDHESNGDAGSSISDGSAPPEAGTGHRAAFLQSLRELSPKGFEQVCQMLLRESGFRQVVVTGRPNDGGIDGKGVLEVNPLVTLRVLFQCKRYNERNPVTPSQVRDFRGAIQGRADKGIILTTGTFTSEARKEAERDGGGYIELVDGEKLVTLFERAELGLRRVDAFVAELEFFEQFREA